MQGLLTTENTKTNPHKRTFGNNKKTKGILQRETERRWQTDVYLLYLSPTTAISASKISNAHAFIYLQNPITLVALWAKVLFIHITLAANKIRRHS